MRQILVVLAILLMVPIQLASACELTEEYKALRVEIYNDARGAYTACKDSVSQYWFWKAVADCESQELGTNVAGGCAHIAGYEVGSTAMENREHCAILEPSADQIVDMLHAVARDRDVPKCVE